MQNAVYGIIRILLIKKRIYLVSSLLNNNMFNYSFILYGWLKILRWLIFTTMYCNYRNVFFHTTPEFKLRNYMYLHCQNTL